MYGRHCRSLQVLLASLHGQVGWKYSNSSILAFAYGALLARLTTLDFTRAITYQHIEPHLLDHPHYFIGFASVTEPGKELQNLFLGLQSKLSCSLI